MKIAFPKQRKMTKSLFDSFEQVSAKQWKQKIQLDLKGADYNEALIFKSLEGVDIKPFYHQEDLSCTYNSVSHPTEWKNAIRIEVDNAEIANAKGIDAIKKGAESIYFIIQTENVDPNDLLQEILSKVPIFIETKFLSATYAKKLNNVAKESMATIFLFTDIIRHLASTGNWFRTLKEDHKHLEEIASLSFLKSTLSVDLGLYQNAGATMLQQLAYGISHANEYLNHFNDQNYNPFKEHKVVFKVALGGNYFFEIAKLRALRILWTALASEYGCISDCYIVAFPSHRNKTILDYNVNMLRTTTECMSAILGGADTIYNMPYDDIYHLENDFGTRISLNQLLILKNESYLDLVENPASGSYYIETLTQQLAEKALTLFKNIENGGGYLAQLKSGTLQRKIKESAQKEQQLFDEAKIVLTGTNKYQNTDEILPEFEKPVFLTKKVRKTLLEPVIISRLSEIIEKKCK